MGRNSRSETGSFAREGHRRAGSYFTPPAVARELARRALAPLRKSKSPLVVDPACGAGALLEAAGGVLPRARLSGCDLDPEALSAARALLPGAHLVHADALALPAPFAPASATAPRA